MNDDYENSRTGVAEVEEERELSEIFALAGRRPEMPAADRAEVEAAAREAWQELLARQRERRRFSARPAALWLAAAAAALVAAALGLRLWQRPAPPTAPSPAVLATVEIVRGDARSIAGGGEARALGLGDRVAAGEATETGTSAVAALRLAGGTSLRLDAGSRLVWLSPARVRLERGALYVDSGPASSAAPVAVETAHATVIEIGTQFEVRLTDSVAEPLRVRVREGSVELRSEGRPAAARAGEELGLAPDGMLRRSAIARYGDPWSWVVAAAPALEIEGQTLTTFLDWVERENGWRIELEGEGLAAAAQSIRLHGSIAGLSPEEAVSVVLPGSGLDYRLADGKLTLARSTGR